MSMDTEQLLKLQKKFRVGMLVKMTAKATQPMFVTGTCWGAHVSVCLSPIRPVALDTPLSKGTHLYGDNPIFDYLDGRFEAYEKYSTSREPKVTSVHSVFVRGDWVKLKDWK